MKRVICILSGIVLCAVGCNVTATHEPETPPPVGGICDLPRLGMCIEYQGENFGDPTISALTQGICGLAGGGFSVDKRCMIDPDYVGTCMVDLNTPSENHIYYYAAVFADAAAAETECVSEHAGEFSISD